MKTLNSLIHEIESKVDFHELENLAVSKSTISWQIDHSLKVINGIIYALKNSNTADYKWNFNLKRSVIFFTGNIPRGVAKAPKSVQSYEKIEKQDLIKQIELSKKLILDIENLDANHNFKHPFLGILNLKQTKKFLKIHTNHHIKIINDILATKKS